MSSMPSKEDFEFLRSIDTPTVCNLVEIVAPARRGAGYTVKHLHCPFPDLPPVDSLPSWDNPKHPSFEFRPADRERRLPSHFWLRCTTERPDDPLLHAAVLAYTSDISSALIQFETERTSTGPSLDHAVWFHRPARMDGWVWQELTPRTAAGAKGSERVRPG